MGQPKGCTPWNKGLRTGPLSKKHKRKIRDALRGVPHTEERKRKNSESQTGLHVGELNPMFGRTGELCPAFGRVMSKEAKKKLSKARKGKARSEETKAKMRGPRPSLQGKNNPMYGVHLVGELNPAWKGGLSFEEYGIEFDAVLKMKIHSRDFYTCQLCREGKGNGKLPDVHHIDYNKRNNNPWNLITLCKRCHGLTNHKRKYWTLFFQDFQRDRRREARNREVLQIIREVA